MFLFIPNIIPIMCVNYLNICINIYTQDNLCFFCKSKIRRGCAKRRRWNKKINSFTFLERKKIRLIFLSKLKRTRLYQL